MKRTALVRKTPLKAKKALSPKPFSPKNKNPATHESVSSISLKKPSHPIKKVSRGLAGQGRSSAHIAFHEQVIATGCIACRMLGLEPETRFCLHHMRGRNKGKGDLSEWLVMCLCYQHHDPTTMQGGNMSAPSVHGNKKLFVSSIGTESWCVHETFRSIDKTPPWLTQSEWSAYKLLSNQESQTEWIKSYEKINIGYHAAVSD